MSSLPPLPPGATALPPLPPGAQAIGQTTAAPAAGGLDLGGIAKKVGGAVDSAYRGVGAARTAAARDPVGALGNILGGAEGAVVGGVMGPLSLPKEKANDPRAVLGALGHGIVGGATDPKQRDKYNTALGDLAYRGIRPQGESMPARIGRGAEDFALQTAIDPVTHGGAQAMSGLLKGGKAVGSAAAKGVKPLGDYITTAKEAINDPRLKPAIGKVAHAVQTLTAPIRGGVNAGKDMLFLNPLPHGLGNMTALNFMKNGAGTTAKGLKYGITGAPKGSVDALSAMKAGAWTPELLDEPSMYGPVGWMSALGKKGVPAAVRGGVGAAAGGAIGNQTAPDTATPQQRAARIAEGSILGGLTGASPEALNLSNKVMSRLETGHRAAMLESLPKVATSSPEADEARRVISSFPEAPKAGIKPKYTAAEMALMAKRAKPTEVFGPATMKHSPGSDAGAFAIPKNAPSRIRNFSPLGESSGAGSRKMAEDILAGQEAAPKIDPRAAQINATFGGGDKSGVAKIATALGGPFAAWQADVVPRAVGSALAKYPARVEAFARGQDITNRDVLKDQPYKLQTGGPVGGAAELAFNTPKYASRLLGPLGGVDPNATTNPKTFDLGESLKGAAYGATPGREVVGPFFGDTLFPSKAPALPSAALQTALGWHFSNKTPATDAILQIMKSGPFTQEQAARLYERYKR